MKAHATVQQKHQQENLRSVVSLTEPAPQQSLDLMGLQTAIGNQAMQSALLRSEATVQRKTGGTGLPHRLKTGIESFSGIVMDDVTVHYNSSQPANVEALAYTQGNEIHLGPGQEKHLPHEAWHVVQQKQGRVTPTMQLGTVEINDDPGLEREADVMSEQALAKGQDSLQDSSFTASEPPSVRPTVQRTVDLTTLAKSVESKETIRGVLSKANLDKTYELPPNINLRKGSKTLDRPKSITAQITALAKNQRGKPSPEYRDVAEMGRWERLAVSSDLAEKTIDVGHLIADNFFDDTPPQQKATAYEIYNLAPQIADFNEHAYRERVEVPVEQSLRSSVPVELKVELDYGSDLNLFVGDLVDRGALITRSTLPPINRLMVPSRMPMRWRATVKPLTPSAGAPTGPSVYSAPSTRKEFTPKVGFDIYTEKTAPSTTDMDIDITFGQGHRFFDPEAKKNPARIGVHAESARYTKKQSARGAQLLSDAKRFKILRTTLASLTPDPTATAGPTGPPSKKRSATGSTSDDEFTVELVDLLLNKTGAIKTVGDANTAVDNLLKKHNYFPTSGKDVLSEDEDATADF